MHWLLRSLRFAALLILASLLSGCPLDRYIDRIKTVQYG